MLKNLVQSLANQVATALNVRMIYGEPISAEGKTIIPVAKVAGGFGAGSGPDARDNADTEDGEGNSAATGGAGGGFAARPVGLIEITPQKTRFIPVKSNAGLWAAAAGGFVLGVLLFRRRR